MHAWTSLVGGQLDQLQPKEYVESRHYATFVHASIGQKWGGGL